MSITLQTKKNSIFKLIKDNRTVYTPHLRTYAMCVVGIIVVNWVANYLLFYDFSLYEDDYFRIPSMMQAMEKGYKAVFYTLFSSPMNVRPFHGFLIYSMSLIGVKLGGIQGVYLLAFFMLLINAMLVFLLISHISRNFICAFAGALALLLYPVVTVKIWLTASFGIQTALTLILFAFISYIYDRKVLSYVLIMASLFCYETVFWVFISAPLLMGRWGRRLVVRTALHIGILSLIFTGFYIFKSFYSDPRLADSSIKDLFYTSIKHTVEGPFYNLVGNLKIPIKTLIKINSMELLFGVICILGLFSLFYKLSSIKASSPYPKSNSPVCSTTEGAVYPPVPCLLRLLSVGLVMLIASYPLTFLGGVKNITGIASRCHLTGVIGISFIYAALSSFIIRVTCNIGKGKIGLAALSLWFTLLMVYNYDVQQDYRRAGNIQRKFWVELVQLCQDVKDGTMIFFYPDNTEHVKSIECFTWATYLVLERLYHFPEKWDMPPRVYTINRPDWKNILLSDADLKLSDLDKANIVNVVDRLDMERKIDPNNSIFLVYKNGLLQRLDNGINAGQKSLPNDRNKYRLQSFQKGVLYKYLIDTQ